MSVLLEFSMFPTDKGESVSEQVSLVIAEIRDSGLPYRLTPMGTIVETDLLGQALDLVERCYQVLDRAGCQRVYASLKLDIRQGRSNGMQSKLDSIREKIGEVSR
ncbi:MAG TPA: MTH1187 family thiamine-binding protein [Gammaproteobacteria bacterium]|nr:MTH1187 family thiamine-binding protein [Gammaproteobacteria bacterium]